MEWSASGDGVYVLSLNRVMRESIVNICMEICTTLLPNNTRLNDSMGWKAQRSSSSSDINWKKEMKQKK